MYKIFENFVEFFFPNIQSTVEVIDEIQNFLRFPNNMLIVFSNKKTQGVDDFPRVGYTQTSVNKNKI